MHVKKLTFVLILGIGALQAAPAAAQVRPGPMPPPTNAPPILSLPSELKAEKPPIPAGDIIKRFSENEDAMLRAHEGYGYRRVVRVEELDDEGKPTGTFLYTTEPARTADGKFYERELKRPDTTLNSLNLEPENLDVLAKIPPLPFTTAQLIHYDLTYAGTQKLDELNTFIFRVKPKQVERTKAYFDGVIWVDDQDFVIVKTTGHWVTELGDVSTDNFPFKFLDTYRENIQGKIWFPSYMRADDSITTKKGVVRVRLIVRWEDYKLRSATPQTTSQP